MGQAIDISLVWLGSVALLSLRLAAALLMTPIFAAASVPGVIRLLIVLGLAVGLTAGGPQVLAAAQVPEAVLTSPGLLLQAVFTELTLGATLALGILLAFAAFTMAGEMLGIQMSFGMGQVLDPATNRSQSVLTAAYGQLAVVVFFLVNGHHAFLRGIAFSLERFPLGRPWPLGGALTPVLEQVTALFTLAFALSAPVILCQLLIEVALGAIARNLPQINMISMGIPVKIAAGLIALSLWFTGIGDAMDRVYASIYRSWEGVFALSAAAPVSTDPLHAHLRPSSGRGVA